MGQYSVAFIEKIERTPAAVSYRFQAPVGFEFLAGQYMIVDLGDGLVHPLTISSCPEEKEFIEFTKRMTGSPYCQRLNSLTQDDTITLKGPMGKFLFDYEKESVALLAGGIGITPIRSILASLDRQKKCNCSIILIYGNADKTYIAFLDELENCTLPDFRLIHVLADTTGVENAYSGFINADILSKEVPDIHNTHYMVSGPPVMVDAMKKTLDGLQVEENRIRTDTFLGY